MNNLKPQASLQINRRFKATSYPVSWYQVAWSHELPAKAVKPIQLCGMDLVIFRGEDGVVRALDAYCPHLGAHLGMGGKVAGNRIRCSFHGWEMDGSGQCAHIPYCERIPPKAKIRSWKAAERYGIIFVYCDPEGKHEGRPPSLPEELERGAWSPPTFHQHKIRAYHSDILENAVDKAHFHILHDISTHDITATEKSDGTLFLHHQTTASLFGQKINTTIDLHLTDPGLQVIHIRSIFGTQCRVLATVTPIDDEWVIARLTTSIRPRFTTLWTHPVAKITGHLVNVTFAEDIPIWDHKIYRSAPNLVKGEETIARFRRWYAKFPIFPVPAAA